MTETMCSQKTWPP